MEPPAREPALGPEPVQAQALVQVLALALEQVPELVKERPATRRSGRRISCTDWWWSPVAPSGRTCRSRPCDSPGQAWVSHRGCSFVWELTEKRAHLAMLIKQRKQPKPAMPVQQRSFVCGGRKRSTNGK